MGKISAFVAGVARLLKTYPAMSAALVNVGVVLAGYFGMNLTPDQLVAYAGTATVLFGIIVHSNVTPLVKLEQSATVLAPLVEHVAEAAPAADKPSA